jgi:ribose-phosphate pyrophosphokinase
VVPYLAYARKDRQTQPHDPVSLRYLAQLFEAVGTAQVIALEVHNPAGFQNAFRIPTLHLESRHALAAAIVSRVGNELVVVASPDPGGAKRAELWREQLEHALGRPVDHAIVDKRRTADRVSGGRLAAGDLRGATVVLVDDLVATGETLQRAALALREAGAACVLACAAHGLFVGGAAAVFGNGLVERVIVTDSVPPFRVAAEDRSRVEVVSCAPLFAHAVRASHASWTRAMSP